MSKPEINIPAEFAPDGTKTPFSSSKVQYGFDRLNPDILAGDNLNQFIDDTYKGLNGVLELYDIKTDTDLSNLTSAGQKVIDGQWVYKYVELANQVNIGPSATLNYSLASYLPDDNYDYEVQLSATGTTLGLTSATMTIIGGSGSLRGFLFANQNTTNATVTGAGNMIVPVPHSNRNININNGAASTCTLNAVRLYGYRRIGTNT